MLKKLATLLAAAAFMAVTAGNALAYFDDLSLVRVVYDSSSATTGKEVAYDLGNINDWVSGSTTSFSTDAITADFSGVALDKLRVAYYAYDNNGHIWLSGGDTAPTVYASSFSNVQNGALMGAYGAYSFHVDGKAVTTTGDATSYVTAFNASGELPGTMSGAYGSNIGEASLADLASIGYVTQKLYFFAYADNGATGVNPLIITTTDTGTLTATPIPPSFLLMGSGLLGMVGIRRKFVA